MIGDGGKIIGEALLQAIRQAVREEIQTMCHDSVKKSAASPLVSDAAKPYLKVKEAAAVACLAPSTIRLYIRKGQLKAYKEGRRVIIKRTDLEKFLEAHPIGAVD